MTLPFTTAEFLDVFRRYNEATWPAALLLPLAGLTCVALLLLDGPRGRRVALAITGALWAWTAVAYHLAFFAEINPAARWFAALALAQAALLVHAAWVMPRDVHPATKLQRTTASVLMAVALVLYPVIGYLMGHRYPASPTFGLPCPTTIFTFGVLAWLSAEVSWRLAIIPVLWAIIGTSAAMQLGMLEDFGLPAAAVTFILLAVIGRKAPVIPSAARESISPSLRSG